MPPEPPPTPANPSGRHVRESDGPLLFAHRGGLDGGHAQNSIAALADALDRGLSLESDVRLSADGIPVLVHDAIRWVLPLPHPVGWRSAKALARRGIPTLADLYRELGHDFELSLDLKVSGAQGPAREVARRAGALDRLWLVHDDMSLLTGIRLVDPTVKLIHEARPRDLLERKISVSQHMKTLARHGIDAQNTHWSHWKPPMVDEAHRRGLLAFGSLAQDPASMRKALSQGLDGLYSDHLEDLLAAKDELTR